MVIFFSLSLLLGAGAVSPCLFSKYKRYKQNRDNVKHYEQYNYNSEEDKLGFEYIQGDSGLFHICGVASTPPYNQNSVNDHSTDLVLWDKDARFKRGHCNTNERLQTQNFIFHGAEIVNEPFKVTRHRRLPHFRNNKIHYPYARTVVDEIKLQLGVPTQSVANSTVIRRLATGIMSEHGLRVSHQKQLLPWIVDAVYTPDDNEIACFEMGNSSAARMRRNYIKPQHGSFMRYLCVEPVIRLFNRNGRDTPTGF
jgi:hypothetical protein